MILEEINDQFKVEKYNRSSTEVEYSIFCQFDRFSRVPMTELQFLELLAESKQFRKSFLVELAISRFETFSFQMFFMPKNFDTQASFFIKNEPDLLNIQADINSFR